MDRRVSTKGGRAPLRKSGKLLLAALAAAAVLGITAFLLVWNGVILLNNPSRETYPVRGVDVSSYQGEIDWPELAGQGIQFAYIKATEGSGSVDPCFTANYNEAQKTGLRIGAYHFFSYDSAGKTQADNFITTVPKTEDMLPPVVDVEFYGDKERNLPEKSKVQAELSDLLARLEDYYGVKPMLYVTEKSYRLFIAGDYGEYDLWVRNVLTVPHLSDGRDWTFWQYTNREVLEGYNGSEKYIDMNVFCGTQGMFDSYGE